METVAVAVEAPDPAVVADLETLLSPSAEEPATDRRREPRYSTDRLTLLHVTGAKEPERILCRILDVSKTGMRVRTQRPLEPGTEIRVTLREMFALAQVRYCVPADEGFDHGIQVQEVRCAPAATTAAA